MPRPFHPARLLALVALLMLPLLTACGGKDTGKANTSLLPMTLAEWLFPADAATATGDPAGVAHLSLNPMKPGDNDLTLRLTDLDGAPLDTAGATPTLGWRELAPDAEVTPAALAPVDGKSATWTAGGVSLADPAWYAFDVTLDRGGRPAVTSTLYALLPDPSVYGGDAVDTPTSDPDAEALYQRAQATYGGWETGRWRENLGSGQDVLVVTQYAVDGSDPKQAAMTTTSLYAGSFQPAGNGSPTVQRNFSERVAIGTRWWSRDSGVWSEASGLPVAGFPERADIYSGATSIRPAGTDEVGGIETRVITFYLPAKEGQAEAWFAWWIDPGTGTVVRMAMVAQMHFMIWDFYDIDAPLDIAPPGEAPATPMASPAATPAP